MIFCAICTVLHFLKQFIIYHRQRVHFNVIFASKIVTDNTVVDRVFYHRLTLRRRRGFKDTSGPFSFHPKRQGP